VQLFDFLVQRNANADEIAISQKSASIVIAAKQTVSQSAKGVISGTGPAQPGVIRNPVFSGNEQPSWIPARAPLRGTWPG